MHKLYIQTHDTSLDHHANPHQTPPPNNSGTLYNLSSTTGTQHSPQSTLSSDHISTI